MYKRNHHPQKGSGKLVSCAVALNIFSLLFIASSNCFANVEKKIRPEPSEEIQEKVRHRDKRLRTKALIVPFAAHGFTAIINIVVVTLAPFEIDFGHNDDEDTPVGETYEDFEVARSASKSSVPLLGGAGVLLSTTITTLVYNRSAFFKVNPLAIALGGLVGLGAAIGVSYASYQTESWRSVTLITSFSLLLPAAGEMIGLGASKKERERHVLSPYHLSRTETPERVKPLVMGPVPTVLFSSSGHPATGLSMTVLF